MKKLDMQLYNPYFCQLHKYKLIKDQFYKALNFVIYLNKKISQNDSRIFKRAIYSDN
jgi:hypothetical protein